MPPARVTSMYAGSMPSVRSGTRFSYNAVIHKDFSGDPGRNRTCDLQLRRHIDAGGMLPGFQWVTLRGNDSRGRFRGALSWACFRRLLPRRVPTRSSQLRFNSFNSPSNAVSGDVASRKGASRALRHHASAACRCPAVTICERTSRYCSRRTLLASITAVRNRVCPPRSSCCRGS
jgi:hypothetical protein